MFRDRGVFQVPAVGENAMHIGRTKDGVIAFELRVNSSAVSPDLERQMVARLSSWLDRLDPPLRVVQGSAPSRADR